MIRRVLTLTGFEWRKLLARRLPLLALLLIVGVALLAPKVGRVLQTASALAQGKGPGAQDAFANGWTALAGAVGAARPFLVIVLLVIAASSLAEETSLGTLQALLVRPVRRAEVLLAKALAAWSYAVALLLAAVSAAALGAELSLGLYDVVDPFYPDRLVHAFGDMWTYVFVATALTITPLLALTGLGLCVSVLLDHPGHATGVAIGLLLLLSAAAGLSEPLGEALFVSYLGAPFGAVEDLANQFTGARAALAPERVLQAVLVPLVWGVGLCGLAALVLVRRDVSRGG